jgi:glucokinase
VTVGIEVGTARVRALIVDDEGHIAGRAEQLVGPQGMPAAVRAAARGAGVRRGAVVGIACADPRSAAASAVLEALGADYDVPAPPTSLGLAAAIAEAWCGAARGVRDLACLVIGDEVSAGLLVDGHPWVGAHGLAGSAGWLALNPVERLDYRQHGCLDAEVSARGIARRLAWRVEAGDVSRVVEQAGSLEGVTAEHVFQGARGGDGVAISVVRDTARYVGMAIANLCALFDPEMVVLSGALAAARDLLVEPVRQECQRRLPPTLFTHLRLEASTLGEAAPALGAARLAATSRP